MYRLHILIKLHADGGCFQAEKKNKDKGTSQLDSRFGKVEIILTKLKIRNAVFLFVYSCAILRLLEILE